MDTTLFFARLLGLYFLVASLFFFSKKEEFPAFIKELEKNPFHLIFSGFMALFLGLTIVLLHPVWSLDLKGLITLIGYWAIFNGIIRLFFPALAISWGKKMTASPVKMGALAGVMALISLSLLYLGFVQ